MLEPELRKGMGVIVHDDDGVVFRVWRRTRAGPLPARPAATAPADVCTVSSSFHCIRWSE
jgi:hypothetical protein